MGDKNILEKKSMGFPNWAILVGIFVLIYMFSPATLNSLSGSLQSLAAGQSVSGTGGVIGDIGGGTTEAPAPVIDKSNQLTVRFLATDKESSSSATLFPTWAGFIGGYRAIDWVQSNSTTVGSNDELILYGDDTTTVYCDSPVRKVATKNPENVDVNCHTVAAETSLSITCYDVNGAVLTAGNNNTDYNTSAMDVANIEDAFIFSCVVTNGDDQSLFRLKSVAMIGNNNTRGTGLKVVNAERITSGGSIQLAGKWEDDMVAYQLRNQNLTISQQAAFTSATGYDKVMTYAKGTTDTIDIAGGQQVRLRMSYRTGAVAPAPNNGDWFGFLLLDGGWARSTDSTPHFNYYVEDFNQRPTEVGVSDTITSPFGRTSGIIFGAN